MQSCGSKLEEAYQEACSTKSDINEHCPLLRSIASQYEHLTEFGMRSGVSTTAFLAASLEGKLKRVISYDIHTLTSTASRLSSLAPDIFKFIQASSLTTSIEETDVLFIDSNHRYNHLMKELTLHHTQVKDTIILHDTVLFGKHGERGGPGLWQAVLDFVKYVPPWFIYEHHPNNCGLTILKKL